MAPPTEWTAGDDRKRFEAALLAQRPHLQRQAQWLAGSLADAEDLVQETMARALRHFGSLAGGANLGAWLGTVMHRLFVDHCRRRRREALSDPASFAEVPAPELEATRPLTHDQIRWAFQRLDPIYRTVSTLYWVEHCPYAEISRRLGVPIATVGSRLLRTRRQLGRMLALAS